MGIALTTLSAFVHPLRNLARWLHPASTCAQQPAQATPAPRPADAADPPGRTLTPHAPRVPQSQRPPAGLGSQRPPRANWPFTVTPPASAARARKRPVQTTVRGFMPLVPTANAAAFPGAVPAPARRATTVVRRVSAHGGSGRVVIAGRMADVCAELDRLAASEATLRAC